jgi:hypothetical protein
MFWPDIGRFENSRDFFCRTPSLVSTFVEEGSRGKLAVTAPEVIKNHAAFIWSVAGLLRGDYKHSEYGRVILPLVVIRRLAAYSSRLRPKFSSGWTTSMTSVKTPWLFRYFVFHGLFGFPMPCQANSRRPRGGARHASTRRGS